MKNYILFLFSLLSISIYATEKDSLDLQKYEFQNPLIQQEFFCDACGCAAGNGSSGFESLLNPQFVGIKYFAQHYKAQENLFTDDRTQDQYFNTIQIWGKIPVTPKLSVYASLPYNFHEKKTLQGDINVTGIADASLMGIYELLQSKNMFHQLYGGIGVKIPLGKFDEKGISGVNPSFQLGTGSWDYQMALSYKYQKNLFALMLNTDYTFKTENKKHYKFGNQWNYGATGFYQVWKNEIINISGKLGMLGEVYNGNRQFGEEVPATAGNAFYGKMGFEVSYKRISVGSELMLPVSTHLAQGKIEGRSRLSMFINFGL